jgi:hypothetical protein
MCPSSAEVESEESRAPAETSVDNRAGQSNIATDAIRREGSAYREQYLDALLARAESRATRDIHAVNDDVIPVLGSKEALCSPDLGQRALGLARVALAQNPSPPLTTAVAQHIDARLRSAGTLDQLRQLADDVEEQIRATPGEPMFRGCGVEALTAQIARIDAATEAGSTLGAGIAQAIEGLRSLAPVRPLSSERLAQLSRVASRLPDIKPLRIEKERLHVLCVRSLEDRTTASASDQDVRHLWLGALRRLALHQRATNHPDAPETLKLCEAPA